MSNFTSKLYKYGIIVGRFQPFHNGHLSIVIKALSLCEKVIIAVGSANESGTSNNPLSFNCRSGIIKSVLGKQSAKVVIIPLNDIGVGNTPAWGDYIIEQCNKAVEGFDDASTLFITGCETRRETWFKNYPMLSTLTVSRDENNISASEIRKRIVDCGIIDNHWFKGYTYAEQELVMQIIKLTADKTNTTAI